MHIQQCSDNKVANQCDYVACIWASIIENYSTNICFGGVSTSFLDARGKMNNSGKKMFFQFYKKDPSSNCKCVLINAVQDPSVLSFSHYINSFIFISFFCCYCIIFLIHTHRLSLFESVIPCFCVAYISANMRSLADPLVYFQSELNEMGWFQKYSPPEREGKGKEEKGSEIISRSQPTLLWKLYMHPPH